MECKLITLQSFLYHNYRYILYSIIFMTNKALMTFPYVNKYLSISRLSIVFIFIDREWQQAVKWFKTHKKTHYSILDHAVIINDDCLFVKLLTLKGIWNYFDLLIKYLHDVNEPNISPHGAYCREVYWPQSHHHGNTCFQHVVNFSFIDLGSKKSDYNLT